MSEADTKELAEAVTKLGEPLSQMVLSRWEIRKMTDEKFLDQKMDRREFLKKAGIGGAGLALGLSGASAFFNNQDSSSKKAYDGDEDISFYGKHQAGITTPMQKACYLVVLESSHN